MWNRATLAVTNVSLAMFILLGAADVDAATYYVRKSGKKKNSGTSPSDAWKKIESAADVMVAGDTVYVGAGTYNERVRPANDGTSGNPIRYVADTDGSMTGDAGDVVMSRNSQRPLEVDGDNYIHVVGFRITGNGDAVRWSNSTGGLLQDCEISCGGNGVTINTNATLTILDCTVRENGGYGVLVGFALWGTDVVISGCTFNNNGNAAIGSLFVFLGEVTATVKNCLIHDNFNQGIQIGGASTRLSLAIWNTTIARNAGAGIEQGEADLTITNSIIAFNTGEGLLHNDGSMTHTYNLVYDNAGGDFAGTSQDQTELSADPLFVNVFTFDYHLTEGSPAVDAGADAAGIVDVDLDGNARPQGNGWDLGCYESSFTGASTGGWRILKWIEIDEPSG
jgi:parallel beta helix pectate lyase-like protein